MEKKQNHNNQKQQQKSLKTTINQIFRVILDWLTLTRRVLKSKKSPTNSGDACSSPTDRTFGDRMSCTARMTGFCSAE